jgi:hypothetical protein
MQVPDVWSVATGAASLISLFLSLGERSAAWRRFTLPGAAALGGFALGRISPALSGGVDHVFRDTAAAGFVLVFFLIISAISLASYLFLKHGQQGFAYMAFIMGLMMGPTYIMPMYLKAVDRIPVGDYVKLANMKATVGEYEQAMNYLTVAADRTESSQMKNELKAQIVKLEKQAAGGALSASPK